MQHEILAPLPLHHADGQLNQPGWARQAYWQYQRSAVPASSWRIKEWDYYAVVSPKGFAFSLTASNLGYAGLYALCVVDLNQGRFWQTDALQALPLAPRAVRELGIASRPRKELRLAVRRFIAEAREMIEKM